MQIFRLIQAFFLAKSSRFKSADFASVMNDDVGCSGRHQSTQCDLITLPFSVFIKQTNLFVGSKSLKHESTRLTFHFD